METTFVGVIVVPLALSSYGFAPTPVRCYFQRHILLHSLEKCVYEVAMERATRDGSSFKQQNVQ
jgi:hypothetical protein